MAINHSVFTASDRAEMVSLLAEAFSQRDPPAVAAGLTAAEFESFVGLLSPKAEAEGLTIVARSGDTGEMMGALLAEDSASALPEGLDRLSAKFDPIFDILSQLETEYRSGQTVRPGELLHLFLLGVSSRFSRQGVAQHLIAACLENGARKGYRVAVTEATNKVSQHVFRKQRFVERVRRSYADHRFHGEAIFASIGHEGGPILMDRPLATE
jgi:ribosomal protein S18 acetylase RimI-like enzyme